MFRRQNGVARMMSIGLLFVLLAVTPAACSGSDTSARSARVATPPARATDVAPSASSTAALTKGQRAALARQRAKQGNRLYRQCPNARAAPPPKDASTPVV